MYRVYSIRQKFVLGLMKFGLVFKCISEQTKNICLAFSDDVETIFH